jgi:hypothetical protein
MARQQEIEDLLRQVAPLFRSIAMEAQAAAADFVKTDWAKHEMSREASVNQMAGIGRWRLVGDRLVLRQGELPEGIELSTSDEEQNQGRYYLCASKLGVVLTIRRKPHKKDDEPEFLQLQIEAAIEMAPIDYGDKVVVYLDVGPSGTEPEFHVANRGKVVSDLRLVDLVKEAEGEKPALADVQRLRGQSMPEPTVRSVLDEDAAQEVEPGDSEN